MGKLRFSGKRLRKMRERERVSQLELALRINAEQAHISNWERGVHVPNEESIRMLCAALKCTEEDLFE